MRKVRHRPHDQEDEPWWAEERPIGTIGQVYTLTQIEDECVDDPPVVGFELKADESKTKKKRGGRR